MTGQQAAVDQLRRLISVLRRATDRHLPASVGDRVTNVARKARHSQHDRQRRASTDDAAYFDQIVAEAIQEGTNTAGQR